MWSPDIITLAKTYYECMIISVLHRAHSLDPQDADIAMYLALELALVRQVKANKQRILQYLFG